MDRILTADDILGQQTSRIREQVNFLKEFIDKNPFAFDENLARQMSQEKFKPYYTELLSDFVTPMQERIKRSTADEETVLKELTRQESLGKTQMSRQTQEAMDAARQGFAGSGLFGSGVANREIALREAETEEKLKDFTSGFDYRENQAKTQAARERADTQQQIDQKQRDIFGTGRAYDTSVVQDVEAQRGQNLRKQNLGYLGAVTDRYGTAYDSSRDFINRYLNL